ncbi:MAG TPA: hypothetical protein VLJ68_08675 [Chitinophagaceae bacterium]|nr:hypothetical protein [Chitinophagaceae bacterium]
MRKILLWGCLVVAVVGCSDKSTGPQNPPAPFVNTIQASLSVNSGAFITNTANASNTGFASSNDAGGNLIIDITSTFQQGTMALKLVNITTPGTYTINNGGSQYIIGKFTIGTDVFTVPAPPPIKGKLTLEEYDAFKIKGTFFMTCIGTNGSVELKGGIFDGKF